MPSFTLCDKYIQFACSDGNSLHYKKALFQIVAHESLKINIDAKDSILNKYRDRLSDNELFRTWLKLMTEDPNNFEKCDEFNSVDNQLLIDVTIDSMDENKVLVSNSKRNFKNQIQKIRESDITLEDSGEFLRRILEITSGQVLINQGQLSMGDNSPNIDGNRNRTK